MKRSTAVFTWIGVGLLAAAFFYSLYWFYRIPWDSKPDAAGFRVEDEVSAGTGENGIPSVDAPKFDSVATSDQYLNDDGLGLDVSVGGKHRFYPYQILVWHEIANDDFDGTKITVTYDPLTRTGMAFDRTVDGTVLTFESTGNLWNDNLLMKDRETGTTWSQVLAAGVDGPKTGAALTQLVAHVMVWKNWKQAYPAGQVLSHDTGVTRDYTRDPYGHYAATSEIWFPLTRLDARLPGKTLVSEVSVGDKRSVYALADVLAAKEIRDSVGGTPVVVRSDASLGTVSAFRLNLDGGDGEELPVTEGFWFVWSAAFPEITLYALP